MMGTTKTDLFTERQNQLANAFKALGHPARIAIVDHLLQAKTCINHQLVQELGLAQATVSQHLQELKNLGIVQGQIEGSRMCYCINPAAWDRLNVEVQNFLNRPTELQTQGCCP